MDFLGPLITGAFGLLGGGGGRKESTDPQAEAIANEIIPEQKKMLSERNRMITDYFDPAMTQKVLPALMSRAATTPFYTSSAMRTARNLEQPMELSY